MDFGIICLVSLVAAGLTLFSGFGLGTVLTPACALFFPLPIAIAITAVVHLANNLFKLALVGRHADRQSVLRFGLPAALTSLIGAGLLNLLAELKPFVSYSLGGQSHEITPLKLIVAALIIVLTLAEILPQISRLKLTAKHLPLGGALSGLFGGLSGQQGALRAAFLLKAGLGRDAFIGTGVVCAVIVDTARLPVYLARFWQGNLLGDPHVVGLVIAATLAAFIGSFIGAQLMHKTTLRTVQLFVTVMLVLIAIALGAGLV